MEGDGGTSRLWGADWGSMGEMGGKQESTWGIGGTQDPQE